MSKFNEIEPLRILGKVTAWLTEFDAQTFLDLRDARLIYDEALALYDWLGRALGKPAVPEGWMPKEAERLMAFRQAVVDRDLDEAHHQIYWIVVDRAADIYNPWAEVEALAAAPQEQGHE